MISIVLLTHNRARLLRQALVTLYAQTPHTSFSLVIVNDHSTDLDALSLLKSFGAQPNCTVVTAPDDSHILARAKSYGVEASIDFYGRADYLLLLDNDVALLDNWYGKAQSIFRVENPTLLGGCRHPFHQPNKKHGRVLETDAVAGYFMMMRWDTWEKYGPLEGNASGIGQSEDWAFSQKLIKAGDWVGYADPPLMLHCGITDSRGNRTIGAEQFLTLPGYVYA